MSGQWVFIQPQDVWMFRDSKPFTAQQSFNARSQFPPNPQTLQGVIRSYYLESQGTDWQAYAQGTERASLYKAVGSAGTKDGKYAPSMGDLQIQGPYIAKKDDTGKVEIFVHAPLDLVYHAENKDYALLSPTQNSGFVTGGVFDSWQPLTSPIGYKHKEGVWLNQNQFTTYLAGKAPQGKLTEQDDLFLYEDRIGLGLDYGRRANVESLLYRAKFVRPCDDVGLLVHVNLDIFQGGNGYLRIGGESRSGRFSVVDDSTLPQTITTGTIKVVLMTPAYFTDGWQPANGDWSAWVGQGARLVSAVIGKPLDISGWDVANNRPKPLRHYVPAGSVYYFEDANWQNNPFTESPDGEAQFDQMGFGCVALGTYTSE